ncbi:MFS general substrate transporter [Thozetella sp. PMI_491]|nr:MFS general substrate transporter [Thozetella sp. PMI_491]
MTSNTISTLKFLAIAGVGLFVDGYLNVSIGLVVPMIGYLYFQDEGNTVPTVLSDVIKGSLSFGMIIGQCLFGLLGDALGRHHVYGKELILTICGTLLVILMPWKGFPHNSVVAWMSVFRVLTGVGTGGDYPMTSSLSAEQNPWGSRAKLVLLLFATLGLGTRASGIVYLVLLVAFKSAMEDDIYRLQWVWRPLFGIGIIPSVATLYFRLKMPETKPYEKCKFSGLSKQRISMLTAQFRDFHAYFSQWKHAKVLFATCSTWFLFDIAFYGINLNQSVILAQIGYRTGDTPWTTLYNTALGNLIVSGAGFLPGYYVAIFLPDLVGRVCQQVACCLIVTVIYAIWAGVTNHTSTGGLITLFTLSQFFLNVGPSATTFLIPVEVFPTRVRATAHGISAASGKAGALLAAFAFGTVKERIGLPGVLDLFAGIMFLVAILTLLIPETKGKTLEEIEHGMLHRAEAPVPSETDGSGTDLPASKGHNEHVKD